MKRTFADYGELEYMTPEEFYAMDAHITIYETHATDTEGEDWAILLLTTDEGQVFRFSDI